MGSICFDKADYIRIIPITTGYASLFLGALVFGNERVQTSLCMMKIDGHHIIYYTSQKA